MLLHLPQYASELVYVGDIQMSDDRHLVEVKTNMLLWQNAVESHTNMLL